MKFMMIATNVNKKSYNRRSNSQDYVDYGIEKLMIMKMESEMSHDCGGNRV